MIKAGHAPKRNALRKSTVTSAVTQPTVTVDKPVLTSLRKAVARIVGRTNAERQKAYRSRKKLKQKAEWVEELHDYATKLSVIHGQ